MKPTLAAFVSVLAFGLPGPGFSQSAQDHDTMNHNARITNRIALEAGQSAFAAIGEIVALLQADPDTDWNRVDIAALRAHLVDMDALTLRATVVVGEIAAGGTFSVTSTDPDVTAAIRRMVPAHGQTMSEVDAMVVRSVEIAGGARMTVTGPDTAMIRGLGFFGVMALGMHHQAHHMALARGSIPHRN